MLSFNEYLKESKQFDNQKFSNDEGQSFSVKKVYEFAKKNKEQYFRKRIPIEKTDALEWWKKSYSTKNPTHMERMESADTSYPLLVIKSGNTLSVADGLNRSMKAHSIENKTHLSAYVIPAEDIQHLAEKPKKKPS
jgi:hypothetical protein